MFTLTFVAVCCVCVICQDFVGNMPLHTAPDNTWKIVQYTFAATDGCTVFVDAGPSSLSEALAANGICSLYMGPDSALAAALENQPTTTTTTSTTTTQATTTTQSSTTTVQTTSSAQTATTTAATTTTPLSLRPLGFQTGMLYAPIYVQLLKTVTLY